MKWLILSSVTSVNQDALRAFVVATFLHTDYILTCFEKTRKTTKLDCVYSVVSVGMWRVEGQGVKGGKAAMAYWSLCLLIIFILSTLHLHLPWLVIITCNMGLILGTQWKSFFQSLKVLLLLFNRVILDPITFYTYFEDSYRKTGKHGRKTMMY